MNKVWFFFLVLFYTQGAFSQINPWYTIENIDKLEINVLFEGSSLRVKPVYDFHIKLYAQIVKKYPEINIMITHKNGSALSRARASRLYARFAGRLQVPYKRISVHQGLSPAYSSKEGEKVLIFLRKSSPRKKTVKKPMPKKTVKIQRPLRVEPKKRDYVYIKRINKEKPFEYSLMGGLRQYNNFTNTSEDFGGLLIGGSFKYRFKENLHFSANTHYVLPSTSKAESNEHLYALGIESSFSKFNLKTKVYGRKNWAWVITEDKFKTVYDYGLHQSLDFKIVRKSSYALVLGFAGEFSLSNNISGVKTANVFSAQTEFKYVGYNSNMFISLYAGQRKYKVFDVDIFGLNLGYIF